MAELEPNADFDITSGSTEVVVTIRGDLDIAVVDALNDRVAPLLERRPIRLVVDASDLRFADSSAIALWVRWASAAAQFELRDPSPLLRRVIAAMGLSEKLAVSP